MIGIYFFNFASCEPLSVDCLCVMFPFSQICLRNKSTLFAFFLLVVVLLCVCFEFSANCRSGSIWRCPLRSLECVSCINCLYLHKMLAVYYYSVDLFTAVNLVAFYIMAVVYIAVLFIHVISSARDLTSANK